jgi:hypothetical protein
MIGRRTVMLGRLVGRPQGESMGTDGSPYFGMTVAISVKSKRLTAFTP